MKQKPKHVNYTGAMLERGQWQNMNMDAEDVLSGSGSGTFTYIAPVFDSRQYEETWQALHLNIEYAGCRLEVIAAASDEDFRQELADPEMSFEEKEALIRSLDGIVRENCTDLLLTALNGRYFYTMWKLYSPGEGSFSISGARMDFPKNTFLEYFPEVYRQGNDFFERYISVFQTLYLNLEKEVDALPDRLDYEKAQGQDLIALAEWTGLYSAWITEALCSGKEETLRSLIGHANEIQSGKGTCRALELLMELLYDQQVTVLEYFKWYEYLEKNQQLLTICQKLYGKENTVSIFLEEKEGEIPDKEAREHMRRALSYALPIGTELRMIPLKKNSHLDSHCYLGKNSHLAAPEGVQTDQARLYGNLVLR